MATLRWGPLIAEEKIALGSMTCEVSSVVNTFSIVEFVDNSSVDFTYISHRTRRREQNRIYLYGLVNLKQKY